MSIHKRRIEQLIKRKPVVIAARILLIIILAIIIAAAGSCLRSAEAAVEEDQIFSVEEIQLLAAAMELENGMNSDLCVILTGTVIINRVLSKNFPNSIKGVLFDKGQYAKHTVDNLYKVKVSDRVMSLALRVATHRPIDPEIVFQSQYKDLGKVKYKIDGEYFATE